MDRYHIKTGFEPGHIEVLKALTIKLNGKSWTYSSHCLDNIKYRFIDMKNLLIFIKNTVLIYEYIFEYYSQEKNIVKICYRIPYNKDQDIILVLSQDKNIVTIYINSSEDRHITLKTELYKNIGR